MFFKDLFLIWENCKKYNLPESDIYEFAEYLEERGKELVGEFKQEVGMKKSVKKVYEEEEKNEKRKEIEDDSL